MNKSTNRGQETQPRFACDPPRCLRKTQEPLLIGCCLWFSAEWEADDSREPQDCARAGATTDGAKEHDEPPERIHSLHWWVEGLLAAE